MLSGVHDTETRWDSDTKIGSMYIWTSVKETFTADSRITPRLQGAMPLSRI